MASTAVAVAKRDVDLTRVASRLPRDLYHGPVYAQGRFRNPRSRAAEAARATQAARLKKYLESVSLGKDVFVYSHIRTNQVVYSLTRALNPNDALRQLTYTGKKSLPASIRKDHWTPMLHIQFPNPSIGLNAYRLLREFRKRHEVEYYLEDISVDPQKPFYARLRPQSPSAAKLWDYDMALRADQLARVKPRKEVEGRGPRHERKHLLMNQRANTVADVAKVLELQTRPLSEEDEEKIIDKYRCNENKVSNKEMKRRVERYERWAAKERRRIEVLEATLEASTLKAAQISQHLKSVKTLISEYEEFPSRAEKQLKDGTLEKKINWLISRFLSEPPKDSHESRTHIHQVRQDLYAVFERGVDDPEAALEEAKARLGKYEYGYEKIEKELLQFFSPEAIEIWEAKHRETLNSERLEELKHDQSSNERAAQKWLKEMLEVENAITAKQEGIAAAKALLTERLTVRAKIRAKKAEREGREPGMGTQQLLDAEEAVKAAGEAEPPSAIPLTRAQVLSRIDSTNPIRIFWSHLADASYAAEWPSTVEHGSLKAGRHQFEDHRWNDRLKEAGYPADVEAQRVKELQLLRNEGYLPSEDDDVSAVSEGEQAKRESGKVKRPVSDQRMEEKEPGVLQKLRFWHR